MIDKEQYSRFEVIELLKKQRQMIAHAMNDVVENLPLVLKDELDSKVLIYNIPQCPFSQLIVNAPTMHIKTCETCAKQGYPLIDTKIVDGKLVK